MVFNSTEQQRKLVFDEHTGCAWWTVNSVRMANGNIQSLKTHPHIFRNYEQAFFVNFVNSTLFKMKLDEIPIC